MEDYKDKDFTKNPVENLGKFGIHPLNEEGKELYISKDFYNHHFLKKKDPELLKEVEEKMKKDREEEFRKLQEVYKREEKKRKEAMGIFEDDEEDIDEPMVGGGEIQNEVKKPKVKKVKKGYNGPWPYPTHYITKSTLKNRYLEKKNIKKKVNVTNQPITGVAAVKGSEKPLIMKEKGNNVKMPKITHVYSGHKTMKEYDSSEVTTF